MRRALSKLSQASWFDQGGGVRSAETRESTVEAKFYYGTNWLDWHWRYQTTEGSSRARRARQSGDSRRIRRGNGPDGQHFQKITSFGGTWPFTSHPSSAT